MNGSNRDAKNIPDQSGKVIVVTGASSKIGKATTHEPIKKDTRSMVFPEGLKK